jgi:hypothetical protein
MMMLQTLQLLMPRRWPPLLQSQFLPMPTSSSSSDDTALAAAPEAAALMMLQLQLP